LAKRISAGGGYSKVHLKTLSSTFAKEKGITLRRAGELFDCKILKTEAEEHDKISEEYVDVLPGDAF
jgi:hypothetical protein